MNSIIQIMRGIYGRSWFACWFGFPLELAPVPVVVRQKCARRP